MSNGRYQITYMDVHGLAALTGICSVWLLSLQPVNASIKQSAQTIDHCEWQLVYLCLFVEKKGLSGVWEQKEGWWRHRLKEKESIRRKESERKRSGIGWRWMLVSGDVGGPLILASSCLVIVYFFWPKIDCSRGRWIFPWTCFSLFHFFFLCQGDNTLTNDASLVFSTLIYFRLQSSSIAGCWKCVCVAKRNGDHELGRHCQRAG